MDNKTKYALLARTRQGNFRVGGLSRDYDTALKRWKAAVGPRTVDRVTVQAFLRGEWVYDIEGYLSVRAADDPAVANATLANQAKRGRYDATVRAYDYRKVR